MPNMSVTGAGKKSIPLVSELVSEMGDFLSPFVHTHSHTMFPNVTLCDFIQCFLSPSTYMCFLLVFQVLKVGRDQPIRMCVCTHFFVYIHDGAVVVVRLFGRQLLCVSVPTVLVAVLVMFRAGFNIYLFGALPNCS